ncbi:TniQ family protein [Paeniglutamicibacter psychrophenolicus]|uniref:TniQ family protein n=1 Tax=Paeniglutamicibacter psychrophenolicus TaxID=257454 RepID=UPI00277D673E|nr:TniQ family protein [Paeniglutamicibacter psychrophenolicus]MDQ0095160.1 hypothetical protein [Paeniglutamicibacter psychrophenolicus]
MKPARKWPVHPAPIEGEALSSWLHRLAAGFHMDTFELLQHGLGLHYGLADVLHNKALPSVDIEAPSGLIAGLAERTGVSADRIHAMTLAGWTPWLLDSVQPMAGAFHNYVHRSSVMHGPRSRAKTMEEEWRAWVPDHPIKRACPDCLADPERQGLLLMWHLPIMLSCPIHHRLLEPLVAFVGGPIWSKDSTDLEQRPSPAVLEMDRRTHQALTTGKVDLPRRSVHAAIWFRLLRTLLNEVSTPAKYWGPGTRGLRAAWAASGHRVRAGQGVWKPFEALRWPIQSQLLEAAAAAMDLLGRGAALGKGEEAALFSPEPERAVYAGSPPCKPNPPPKPVSVQVSTYEDHWAKIRESMEEIMEIARGDPSEAQVLYNFMLYGCRTPEAAERVLADFEELGIAIDQMEHKPPIGPYA